MNQLPMMGMMAFAALLGAVGQILLKKASGNFELALSTLTNKFLWFFAICYILAVVIQLLAYKMGGNVSVIYPVVSLSYAFSAFFAWKWLGEPVSSWTILGIGTIIIGVSMIGYGAS